ncbi:hypothetical protein C666_18670 [Thauera linaloolentis 47Lol = DSM 12138]|uniref:Type II toxin-antitoxin system HicB family antitoxin n=1 Tax=Thauera linaloolentis (strain DSM 12138 / JCM 21573 / CCUG 41526 / CIP 105981 / IAM 15112 / NBRC 102519 / 47Lol) TaxID=1123367 RepID=N6XWE4_THAL4|nr:hypothetical protein C666_18670 [Thauera linaloolentis 47Lol = DSM 12138]
MSCTKRRLNYVLFKEEGAFVARCVNAEVASDCRTEQEAAANLQEALDLYFENDGTKLAEPPS